MTTLMIVSFFIVALATLQPAKKNSLYSILYTQYLPTDRVIIAIFLSFKYALFLLLLTFFFIPVVKTINLDLPILYLLTGGFLTFYSFQLIKSKHEKIQEKRREETSSFLKEAWGLKLFSSKSSMIVLFIYMLTLQETYNFSLFNFGILDLIIAILLGILFLCADLLFKLSTNRRPNFFKRILAILLSLIGASFFIKGLILF